jgi:hypothetical protein
MSRVGCLETSPVDLFYEVWRDLDMLSLTAKQIDGRNVGILEPD